MYLRSRLATISQFRYVPIARPIAVQIASLTPPIRYANPGSPNKSQPLMSDACALSAATQTFSAARLKYSPSGLCFSCKNTCPTPNHKREVDNQHDKLNQHIGAAVVELHIQHLLLPLIFFTGNYIIIQRTKLEENAFPQSGRGAVRQQRFLLIGKDSVFAYYIINELKL